MMAAPEQSQTPLVEGEAAAETSPADQPVATVPAAEGGVDSLLALDSNNQPTDNQPAPANPAQAAAPAHDLLLDTSDMEQPGTAPQIQPGAAQHDPLTDTSAPASPAVVDLLGDYTSPAPESDATMPAAVAVPQQPSPAVAHPLMAALEQDTSATPAAELGSNQHAGNVAAASSTSGSMSPQTVRRYLDITVVPVLRMGLRELCVQRPQDPFQFLADYILAHRPKQ